MVDVKFFGALLVSICIYWLIPKQALRNIFLVLASIMVLFLYDKWSPLVVVCLSVWSWAFGYLISKKKHAALYHCVGVIGLLGSLAVFKYLGFLAGVLSHLNEFISLLPNISFDHLILPLGISYLTFKCISYITDIKWGLIAPARLEHILMYNSLFTIFIAGPIERYERFGPQYGSRIEFKWKDIDYGFARIVLGLFKKLVIADWLGYFIAPVWSQPWNYTSWSGLLALLGYSLQIYFDFSGYSDIAIGSSRLFGLKIMENFKNPYLAPNISQFWRRWHISLSDWIRDYIFFPLSRISKNIVWTMFLVPIIAMGLCGLWHGAAWHFALWGMWHGLVCSYIRCGQIIKDNAEKNGLILLVNLFHS